MIGCSNYVCGGNFSGFKDVDGKNDIGDPIVEIGTKGDCDNNQAEGNW
jgi:hypothetical protein